MAGIVGRESGHIRVWGRRFDVERSPDIGICGRPRRLPRACWLLPGAARRCRPAAEGAGAENRLRLDRLLYRRPCRLRRRQASDPAPIRCPSRAYSFPPSVTGLIGGYQAGYNRQLANNVVLGIEADAIVHQPASTSRALRVAGALQHHARLCRHGARPRRLCLRTVDALRHRRLRLGAHAMSTSTMPAAIVPLPKRQLPYRLDRGPRRRIRRQRQLDRQGRIRLHRAVAPDLRPQRLRLAPASTSIPTFICSSSA